MRDHKHFGGLYRESAAFTGDPVTNFTAPVSFSLRRNGDEISFDIQFEAWEDTQDFDKELKSLPVWNRKFSSSAFEQEEIVGRFGAVTDAIEMGVLEFLELNENFELESILIEALGNSIDVVARHKTRSNYTVRDSVRGAEEFGAIKMQYLKSIVMPLLGMAHALAAEDRNLSKFKAQKIDGTTRN